MEFLTIDGKLTEPAATLVENYSNVRASLLEIDMDDVRNYIRTSNDLLKVYSHGNLDIVFRSRNEAGKLDTVTKSTDWCLRLADILEEFKTNKIRLALGELIEPTKDDPLWQLDYGLMIDDYSTYRLLLVEHRNATKPFLPDLFTFKGIGSYLHSLGNNTGGEFYLVRVNPSTLDSLDKLFPQKLVLEHVVLYLQDKEQILNEYKAIIKKNKGVITTLGLNPGLPLSDE